MRSRTLIKVVACVAVVGFVFALPAEAASPGSGTISKAKRSVTWKGAEDVSFMFPDPVVGVVNPGCDSQIGEEACDHFALRVTLGDTALVEVKITTPNPCSRGCSFVNGEPPPVFGDDYDLFVYDANGAEVAKSTTAAGYETLRFKHKKRFNGKPYDVAVLPWAVSPGSTYKGSAKAITLGK